MNVPFSLSTLQPIAYGRRSEIFTFDDNKILKLYLENFPQNQIETEFKNASKVFLLGKLLVPQPFEILRIGGRTGIVFERISGQSYMDLFQQNPLLYFTKAKFLANLHQQVHQFSTSGIATQKQVFSPLILQSERLTKKEKEILLRILSLPHKPMLCHGDFHHGNVIKAKGGRHYILDWMNAFIGDPDLDIALTAVNAAVSDAPEHVPVVYRKAYEVLKKLLALDSRILRNYPELNQEKLSQLVLLAAGIHLVRKDGNDFIAHRKYFDDTILLLTSFGF